MEGSPVNAGMVIQYIIGSSQQLQLSCLRRILYYITRICEVHGASTTDGMESNMISREGPMCHGGHCPKAPNATSPFTRCITSHFSRQCQRNSQLSFIYFGSISIGGKPLLHHIFAAARVARQIPPNRLPMQGHMQPRHARKGS